MVASEPNTGQELADWLRQECTRLRAEAGNDPVAWLRARMDEAERLQDEWMADNAMHDFDFATYREDGEPTERIPDDVYIQRIRIRSPNGRWDQALGIATEPPRPERLSPRGMPYGELFTPAEDWEDIQYAHEWEERRRRGEPERTYSWEEMKRMHPELHD